MARYSKEERVERIIGLLNNKGSLFISDLVGYFSVSHMTIRRDIDALQKKGRVKMVFGGRITNSFIDKSPEYTNKAQSNMEAKNSIAVAASKLLMPDTRIFMDGGTTVKALAYLIDIPLTAITNDITTACILNDNPQVKTILCPGEISKESRTAYSTETLRFLADCYSDIAFIGADGFSEQYGAMTTTQSKADCKWMAANRAEKSVLLVDSSKENVFCPYKIADMEYFSDVLTDNK